MYGLQAERRASLILSSATKYWRPLFILAWIVWFFDFLTKYWAENYLREPIRVIGELLKFQLTTNTGAAFSLNLSSAFLMAFAILTSFTIFYFAPRITSKSWAVALGLVLGGALGNLTDRIFRGEVVDWISIKFWPTFNLADSAVVAAAIFSIVLTARNISPVSRSE